MDDDQRNGHGGLRRLRTHSVGAAIHENAYDTSYVKVHGGPSSQGDGRGLAVRGHAGLYGSGPNIPRKTQFENLPKDLSNIVDRSDKGLKLADVDSYAATPWYRQ